MSEYEEKGTRFVLVNVCVRGQLAGRGGLWLFHAVNFIATVDRDGSVLGVRLMALNAYYSSRPACRPSIYHFWPVHPCRGNFTSDAAAALH